VAFQQTEQLNYQILLKLVHGKGFAGASLAVGKASNDPVVDEEGSQGFERALVDVLRILNSWGFTS